MDTIFHSSNIITLGLSNRKDLTHSNPFVVCKVNEAQTIGVWDNLCVGL